MPQIGWFELLIVVLVAILIIGPKDFPVVLRKLGSWIGSTKKYFSEIRLQPLLVLSHFDLMGCQFVLEISLVYSNLFHHA